MDRFRNKIVGPGKAFTERILSWSGGFSPKSIIDLYYYRRMKGILPELENYKRTTIRHVIKRAQELGYTNLRQYYMYLQHDVKEQTYMNSNMTLKGSHFFRGNDWGYFRDQCLSQFSGRKGLKLWCAGCSSGEEVYSLIMALLDYVPLSEINVLATDYNDELLEKCRKGKYGNSHYTEVPERYQKYLEKDPKGFAVQSELVNLIHLRNLNLLTDPFPEGFDIILCRNVLKFFSRQMIAQTQEKLAMALNKDGFLFLSADDNHDHREFIAEPASMGLKQMDDRCIYQKTATFVTSEIQL